jgi:cell division septal protein FtsQ
MVKRHYRKPHRYKKKRPILSKRFFWLGILFLIVVGAVFYCLFFLNAFQVEKIIVSGEEKVSKEEIEFLVEARIENRVLFFRTKSIFAVDVGQIKRDILNFFPQIAEVKVSRSFFDAVNVAVVERKGVALWCQDEACFLVDEKGIIFEEILTETDLFKIEKAEFRENPALGEPVLEEATLDQILYIRDKLAEIVNLPTVEAFLASAERLNVRTAEDWEIYFNLKGDLDWQITELVLVLEKQISPEKRGELEYIDLRFSRVFYK